MRPGTLLQDTRGNTPRFRVEELLVEGKHYQIVLATDTLMDDKKVCVKAINYDAEHLDDPDYVEGRRRALREEMAFLTLSSHLIPEPLDWLELDGAQVGMGPEPTLVYEYQHGQTLHELVTQRHPRGLEPARALKIFRELVRFCGEIHAEGYILRDFDPRHVIVGFDDIIHVVGCGNAVERGEKMNVYKMNTNPSYTAPEIRRELSGKVVRPACDFYSLGCLLSFALTGVEPMPRPESPLDVDAFDMLNEKIPEGYRLLVARCIQPLSQKRFATAERLLPYCDPKSLPTRDTEGFEMVMLPTPWSGPEGMDNRALRSKLSPGPLISVRSSERAAGAPAPDEPAAPAEEGALAERPGDQLAEPKKGCARFLGLFSSSIVLFFLAALAWLLAAVK